MPQQQMQLKIQLIVKLVQPLSINTMIMNSNSANNVFMLAKPALAIGIILAVNAGLAEG